MNVRQLTTLLADKAHTIGVSAPSERVVRSWIEKGIIPGASPSGGGGRGKPPIWTLSDSSVSAALSIMKFSKLRAVRSTEFIALLWLEGYDYPAGKTKSALAREIDRVSARHFPDGYPAWLNDAYKANKISVSERQNRQLGDQDIRLAAFRPQDADILKLTSFGFSGYPGEMNEGQLVRDLISQKLPELLSLISQLPLSFGLAGIFAKPLDDQTPSQNVEAINAASEAQLRLARSAYQFVKSTFEEPQPLFEMLGIQLTDEQLEAFTAAAYSLNASPWAVYTFVLTLRFIRSININGEGLISQRL